MLFRSKQSDLYAAIDLLVDKLDRQVLRYKDKLKGKPQVAVKRRDIGA